MNTLQYLASESRAYAIVLNETWLKPTILDQEVKIKGYNIYRTDREGPVAHGGVCIYLREDITATIAHSTSKGLVQTLGLKIKPLKLFLYTVYRPGESTSQDFNSSTNELTTAIEITQANGQYPNLLGLGDFNFPNMNWTPGMLPQPGREGGQINSLVFLLRETFSFQLVN